MLIHFEQAQDKSLGSTNPLEKWLNARQSVLVSYCELAGLFPFEKPVSTLPAVIEIKRFCLILLDYISAGHFEIFDTLVTKCKNNGGESAAVVEKIYQQINTSTDFALQFNDKYAETEVIDALTGFDNCLSTLGRHLEQRFVLEDQLLANIDL